ncbi:putative acetyltransferase [Idiomarina fontislapidosi]|uniref:GNAT family N-acetyltransferase n=1 Tax=Idiomarina fontislapidosi TaxID=263723 RepID=A0A432YA05_9GAMM|nr:GNAT family N-acetyltransferase [Idiomarina fontislapidosi]PYE34271.1 putative acetyltransferase [Idiomarina fontislapidosi]RUO57763.1 GNAT family N-acetyltransferase [Idiomarina fontislapidosi]
MEVRLDDLSDGKVIALLEEHLRDMYATSPAESVHALKIHELKAPDITFFSARENQQLAGCIAIKRLNQDSAEIKSMRTVSTHRNKGVASKLLAHVLDFAKQNSYKTIGLETGTQDYFLPARNLYAKFGFTETGPFGSYKLDPSSYFMQRVL